MPDNFKHVADKLNTAGNVLVVLSPAPTADTVAAGLALSSYLRKMEKDAIVLAADGSLNPRVDFLSGYDQVVRELNVTKSFVIDVSTVRTQISELSYKKEGDNLAVYLKPKSGQFSPEDVSFRESKFPYDLVVTIGVAKLEDLGDFYGKFAELFFETPILNIDFRGVNESFGQFNLVDLNAASQSEIVFDLISEMEKDLIDADTATTLLAGIISETNSFQHSKTTPAAFLKASQLIGMGGRQQDIVNRLYKNKSMGMLKLWGRVLARLKHEPEIFLVSSAVKKTDVEKANATQADVAAILKEMVHELGFAKIHVFFREVDEETTEIYCSSPTSLDLAHVFAENEPDSVRPQHLHFIMHQPLQAAEQSILEKIRTEAKKLA